MNENIFYDVHEQTKYSITVSKPENMEDLSDLFITHEELAEILGRSPYASAKPQPMLLHASITSELKKWADKLDASGKKTLLIEDEELLEVLKRGYLSDYLSDHTRHGASKYGRHGDRICYARRYKRVKKKATQGDVTALWYHMLHGFRAKYGCFPSHIPRYERGLNMFRAFQKIVGWRRTRAQIGDQSTVKFMRQIWDNPEEFIR